MTMALYMAQFAYTSEAWTAFTKNPENRTAAVQALAQKLGCRMEAAPDETTVSAFVLAALGPGHFRATRTTVLMRAEAVVEALKKAATVWPPWRQGRSAAGTNPSRSKGGGLTGSAPVALSASA
jgi:uncharacterized protein with GYD domain